VCNDNYNPLYTIYKIINNFWSLGQQQGAGTIGFGFGNQIISQMIDYGFMGFTLQMSNFTDLTFAQPGYKPHTNDSTLTLSSSRPSKRDVMTLPLPTAQTPYLQTSEFSFGLVYANGTAYFQSINNDQATKYDPEGSYVNTTKLETTLNGLALPP